MVELTNGHFFVSAGERFSPFTVFTVTVGGLNWGQLYAPTWQHYWHSTVMLMIHSCLLSNKLSEVAFTNAMVCQFESHPGAFTLLVGENAAITLRCGPKQLV